MGSFLWILFFLWKKLILPNSLTTISGNNFLQYNYNIKKITANGLITISGSQFCYVSSIKTFAFPALKSITNERTCAYSRALKYVDLSNLTTYTGSQESFNFTIY